MESPIDPNIYSGVTDYPGLYFVGLPWLHNAKSGLLFGLRQDAEHIAAAIDEGPWNGLDGILPKESLAQLKNGAEGSITLSR